MATKRARERNVFAMTSPITIRVLTLNCWGVPIPFACKLRNERMVAIATELSKGQYDIVILQEIWTQTDYEVIYAKVRHSMPYSHYFHSGLIGSGVCIFSKGPIKETFFHRYSLNGYFHKIHHGDWLGGKGVGVCRITHKGLKINVYGTHIHAEYCRADDEYLAHRISQSFELSQFVKYTTNMADISIVGGDFNLEPSDLGYKIIRCNSQLLDAWLEKDVLADILDTGMTCDCPSNSFTDPKCLEENVNGKRIDYIMYCASREYDMKCDTCYTTMDRVDDENYNYSDHEGVAAIFKISPTTSKASNEDSVPEEIASDASKPFFLSTSIQGTSSELGDTGDTHTPGDTPGDTGDTHTPGDTDDIHTPGDTVFLETLLLDAINIIEKQLTKSEDNQYFYKLIVFISIFILLLTTFIDPSFSFHLIIFRFIVYCLIGYCMVMELLWLLTERKSLLATKNNLHNLWKSEKDEVHIR